MAISTIIILMTINGLCEQWANLTKVRLSGALVAGIGVIGPFLERYLILACGTDFILVTLIPVAYLSFFLLINNSQLSRERPLEPNA